LLLTALGSFDGQMIRTFWAIDKVSIIAEKTDERNFDDLRG
jgi:hypothetical protein